MIDQNELKSQLNYLTEEYDKGTPKVSDKEWDDLYFQLDNVEDQDIHYNFVTKLNKVNHNHKMLSLNKTKDLKDVEQFLNNQSCLAMAKMDGLTCSLRYLDGKLVSAETRGNGLVGEDITHNALVIPSIPNKIPYKNELIVDGEIICTYKDFESFSDSYKDPRNFAAGSIRLLDANECKKRNLTFVVWDCIKGLDEIDTLNLRLNELSAFDFITVPRIVLSKEEIKIEIFEKVVEDIKQLVKEQSYPIDGVVFKFNNIDYGLAQGETAHHFKNAIAYKFYDEMYQTVLRDIEWTMGRTGALTPIAVFDSVTIDNCIINKASLHNLNIMEQILKRPYKNQSIQIFRANMIIPQVASGEQPIDDNNVEYFSIPTHCPYCNHEVTIVKDILYCTNDACSFRLINRLDHFCGKKGLDIKGLSIATLEKLLSWGWINNYSDIFNLKQHRNEWINKTGFGEKSVDNILAAIEESRTCSLDSFISAIGIPLIGHIVAKELIKNFNSYEEFREKINNHFDFSQYEGFADSKTNALLSFDYTEADKIYPLMNITSNNAAAQNNDSLIGKTIVITGKLIYYKNRAALQADIEKCGGKVVGSISKATDILINNDIDSTSTKNITAKKLNIPIMNEKTFSDLYLTF